MVQEGDLIRCERTGTKYTCTGTDGSGRIRAEGPEGEAVQIDMDDLFFEDDNEYLATRVKRCTN